jgi:hypothetical protein
MGLDVAAVAVPAGLGIFWVGFGLGHYHGGREESRRQVLKLEKRRELDKIQYQKEQTDAETKNKFWEWYGSGQEPRHVRIQAPSERASSEGEARCAESQKEPSET